MNDPRECICDDGNPTWCDRHGDIWYDDSGDAHYGRVPPLVRWLRESEGSELGGIYPLRWEFPIAGLMVSYVDDRGRHVTRGMR